MSFPGQHDIIFSEKTETNKKISYVSALNGALTTLEKKPSFSSVGLSHVKDCFTQVFLPHGYPQSVSSDYLDYQIWDTVQAFCSTISGTLTTHAIFRGIGVGDTTATALSATITWIMKDGTGMIGRIGFAWWKGYALDTDCKKWRLAADVINDVAMSMELLLGSVYFRSFSPILLCCSNGMKSIVGVAGGATRAAITQHQAIRNNMADVSAKDGSQETCVNLIASFVALFILTRIEESFTLIWTVFIFVSIFHIFANYKAVRSLKLKTLNESRFILLMQYYMRYDEVFSPDKINREESIFPYFSWTDHTLGKRKIFLGKSLKKVIPKFDAEHLSKLRNNYKAFSYCIVLDDWNLYVSYRENITDRDVIMSYFHAYILNANLQRSLHKDMASSQADFTELLINQGSFVSIENRVNDFVVKKWTSFIEDLASKGWNIDQHQLPLGEWRIKWNL